MSVDFSGNGQNVVTYEEPKWLRLGAPFLVFLVALAGFLQTVQRTVSFWDCGEFIATSVILGIPHPPGAPTFNLLGRFFSLIPIGDEIAWRVNLISVLTSAFAILFLFLILREIYRYLFPNGLLKDTVISIVSAGAVSLMCAFSDTFWFNAVEAEVYGVAMFFLFLSLYLAMIWFRHRQETGDDRYLIFLFFTMFLGIGGHMFSLLFFPAIFVLMVLVDKESILDAQTWLGILGMLVAVWSMNKIAATYQHSDFAVALIGLFLAVPLMFAMERLQSFKNWHYWFAFFQLTLVIYAVDIFVWFNAFSLVAYVIISLTSSNQGFKNKLRFLIVSLLVAAIGYSTYLYIPIRSQLNPTIDENNPETVEQFKLYLERKQYGEPDIWSRITKRYGSWSWQFGYMINYLKTQFNNQPHVRYLFPAWALLFLLGCYYLWRHSRNYHISLLISLVVFIAIVGLVIYMNFSDGLHGKQTEVRDRDYFHTPSFLIFGMMMGVGLAGVLHYFSKLLKSSALVMALSVPMLALPYMTYYQNLPTHNRSKDWMPHDYAYNILVSCPKNAILFTQGDNDTFPLWFMQEVKKFRKDVRIVNLSLLNADWYIKQLKYLEPKVGFGLTDEEIDKRLVGAFYLEKDYNFRYGNITTTLPKDSYIRVQDIGVMELIKSNYGKRPICFSMTVGDDGRIGLDRYFVKQGMVYEIVDTVEDGPVVNTAVMEDLLVNKFRFTNLADSSTWLGKDGSRYVWGYAQVFNDLANAYLEEEQQEKARQVLEKAIEYLPYVGGNYHNLASYYERIGDTDKAIQYYKLGAQRDPEMRWYMNYYISEMFRAEQVYDSALYYIQMSMEESANEPALLRSAIMLCRSAGNRAAAEKILNSWLIRFPQDQFAHQLRDQLNDLIPNPTEEN